MDAVDLGRGLETDHALRLLEFEIARARSYYRESEPLLGLVHASGRPMLWAIVEIYRRLLDRIERDPMAVLRGRVRLPAIEKSWIVLRAMARRR